VFVMPSKTLWADAVHNANIGRTTTIPNRRERREKERMAKGKPSKGTPKDKRLKRNKRGKKK
jgi:hypothetical protein